MSESEKSYHPEKCKSGRFSKDEWSYIKRNADSMTPYHIAKALNRTELSIREYIEKKLGKFAYSEQNKKEYNEYDLKRKLYWGDLKRQFDNDELELIVYHWSRIIAQFNQDVTPTEELQILDVIKMEILMGRMLIEQQENYELIKRLEGKLDSELEKSKEDQNADVIHNTQAQLQVMSAAKKDLNSNYERLQKNKNSQFSQMKATREQRQKNVEDYKKENFATLIKKLIKDPHFSEKMSLDMEKFRLAAEVETERLSVYHKYEDGQIDQPLLTPDTVISGD